VFLWFLSQTTEAVKLDALKRGRLFPLKPGLSIVPLYVVISQVKAVSLNG